MKRKNINKSELNLILKELKIDAIQSEKENQASLKRIGVNAEIIADKQYWNGYLDCINNLEIKVKKFK